MRRPSSSMLSLTGGFPDNLRVKLKYTTHYTTSPSTTPTDYVFRGNSPFDPDFTSTGGQPYNYDIFSLLYQKYRCYGSRIQVWSNTTTMPFSQVTLSARTTSTAIVLFSTLEAAQSGPYCKHSYVSSQNGQTRNPPLAMTLQTEKVTGVPIVSDDCAALYTANPAAAWYWHVNSSSIDQSTASPTYHTVSVEYDVEWFALVPQILSLEVMSARLAGVQSMKAEVDRRTRADEDTFQFELPELHSLAEFKTAPPELKRQ